MRSIRHGSVLSVVALTICLSSVGCMEPQTSPVRPASTFSGSYRTQTLNTTDLHAAFAAAEGAVADYFQVASADANLGVITFLPSEYTRIGGARMRRVGRLGVYKTGNTVVASVQIEIQRYLTPNMRAMSHTLSPDDRPGLTPIQEEGGLTPAQQEYWNPEGRDSRMEAEILQRIAEAVNQSATTTQPAEK